LGLAGFDLLDGHAHRGIFFAAQGHFERVVHLDPFQGWNDAGPRMLKGDLVWVTHQQQVGIGMAA
jgi:hypothetical protein